MGKYVQFSSDEDDEDDEDVEFQCADDYEDIFSQSSKKVKKLLKRIGPPVTSSSKFGIQKYEHEHIRNKEFQIFMFESVKHAYHEHVLESDINQKDEARCDNCSKSIQKGLPCYTCPERGCNYDLCSTSCVIEGKRARRRTHKVRVQEEEKG